MLSGTNQYRSVAGRRGGVERKHRRRGCGRRGGEWQLALLCTFQLLLKHMARVHRAMITERISPSRAESYATNHPKIHQAFALDFTRRAEAER